MIDSMLKKLMTIMRQIQAISQMIVTRRKVMPLKILLNSYKYYRISTLSLKIKLSSSPNVSHHTLHIKRSQFKTFWRAVLYQRTISANGSRFHLMVEQSGSRTHPKT